MGARCSETQGFKGTCSVLQGKMVFKISKELNSQQNGNVLRKCTGRTTWNLVQIGTIAYRCRVHRRTIRHDEVKYSILNHLNCIQFHNRLIINHVRFGSSYRIMSDALVPIPKNISVQLLLFPVIVTSLFHHLFVGRGDGLQGAF